MAEYRSVNFYELCRLCAASQGTKVNLFSDSSRKQGLVGKISECLPVSVDENDSLPKTICELCIQQVQQISEYRQKCVNTQTMLEGCLGTNKLKTEGRVYIKDEAARAGPGGCKPATNIVTLKNSTIKPTLVPLQTVQHQQQQQIQVQQTNQQHLDQNSMTISQGNDYLSSIVQSVGIDSSDQVQSPQYTLTIKEMPTDQQRLQTYSGVDEFLKPKPDAKPQYNLVLNQNNQLQQITTSPTAQTQMKQVMTTSPYVLTNTGQLRTVSSQGQQQTIQMVQSQPKYIVKDNSQQVYQIKLEPQMDGQTIYQLTPAPAQTTYQTVTSPQDQMNTRQGTTKVLNRTPIQFTTLTNANSATNKSSPTMISIQDTPGKGQTATQITPVGRIASTTITRKTPLLLKQDGTGAQIKYITAQSVGGGQTVQSTPIFVQAANSGPTTVKVLSKASPRTVVMGGKTVKMISQQAPPAAPNMKAGKVVTMLMSEESLKPTCDVCQKEFKRKEHLVQHMKLHQGVRPFKCDLCDKAFNRKEHLLRHRTSHTGTKSFKCEHCQKMFSRKDNLNKHKRKHLTGEDEGVSPKKFKTDEEEEEIEEEEEEEVFEEEVVE